MQANIIAKHILDLIFSLNKEYHVYCQPSLLESPFHHSYVTAAVGTDESHVQSQLE